MFESQELGNQSRERAGVRSPRRRSFLGALMGLGTAGVGALLSVPLVRYAIYPLVATTTETKWSDIGSAIELGSGMPPMKRVITIEQRDGWRKLVSEKAVYIIKDKAGQLRVFSTVCPHLGCSISWNDGRQQFVCPCHGGIFAADGATISGPPPRAMDELPSKIENGTLRVRYQYFRQLVRTKEVLG